MNPAEFPSPNHDSNRSVFPIASSLNSPQQPPFKVPCPMPSFKSSILTRNASLGKSSPSTVLHESGSEGNTGGEMASQTPTEVSNYDRPTSVQTVMGSRRTSKNGKKSFGKIGHPLTEQVWPLESQDDYNGQQNRNISIIAMPPKPVFEQPSRGPSTTSASLSYVPHTKTALRFGAGKAPTTPMKRRKEILQFLLATNGRNRQIFLSPEELDSLHLEEMNDFFAQLRHQLLAGALWHKKTFAGVPATFALLGIASIVFSLGLIITLLGRMAVELRVPYSIGDTLIDITVNEEWNTSKEILVYYEIRNFHHTARSFIDSRPMKIFRFYRDGGYNTVKSMKRVRPAKSIPEVPLNSLPNEQHLFPSGLASFALFNDEASLLTENSAPVHVETSSLSPQLNAVIYARRDRPWGLTPADDWIDPLTPRYRNWMNPQPGSRIWLLAGSITDGLAKGSYTVMINKNVWPSDLWRARKALVFHQLSPLGSHQTEVGFIYLTGGCIMFVLTGIFLILWCCGFKVKTQSALQVPTSVVQERVTAICNKYEVTRRSFDDMTRRLTSPLLSGILVDDISTKEVPQATGDEPR